MNVAACRNYHAITSRVSVVEMPDGKSAYKVYYLSILGRDKPELYEWERCDLSKEAFEGTLRASGQEGIGFVTAFPHITKIMRFGPGMETVMDIREFDTDGLKPRDCSRPDGYHEFACYAEAVIAAEEYHAWAKAETVNAYLGYRCHTTDFPVASSSKLKAYFEG